MNPKKSGLNKAGQIQVTFNWIYILIAGAVILLFFVGIVVKQKAVSEDKLTSDVVRIMESIFTGASVSEKTKNFVDTSGLADYTLYFNCEDGFGEYGIKDGGARAEVPLEPVFAPAEIKSSQLILWSLPYKLPFKVTNFLFVTSKNSKYFVLGTDPEEVNNFINVTEGLNVEYLFSAADYNALDPESNFQVRIIDFDGNRIVENAPVPNALHSFNDDKVTAVSFSGTNQVDYYQKKGEVWFKSNKINPVQIVSLPGERDAAKYGAIFADNEKVYYCNMQKAFKRLQEVLKVYAGEERGEAGGKLKLMLEHYQQDPPTNPDCLGYLEAYGEQNLLRELVNYKTKVKSCLLQAAAGSNNACVDLIGNAAKIKELNKNLGVDCLTLY